MRLFSSNSNPPARSLLAPRRPRSAFLRPTTSSRSQGRRYAAFLVAALAMPPLHAADQHPPGRVTFQGFLSDTSTPSVPLGASGPTNVTVVFRIYDSPNVTSPRWAEQQVVTVDKGHFSVLLGEGSAIGNEFFTNNLSGVFAGGASADRFIAITVPNLGIEAGPRIPFHPAPYSQLSRAANSLLAPSGSAVLHGSANGVSVAGIVSAGNFFGSAKGLTAIPASAIAGTFSSAQLSDAAVTQSKIAPGGIGSAQILPGAVSAEKLANNAVTTEKLALGAVDSSKIANGSVTAEKLAPGAAAANLAASGGNNFGSLVFSDSPNNPTLAALGYVRISRTSLGGDSWQLRATETTANTPTDRRRRDYRGSGSDSDIWTGSKFVVWGGVNAANSAYRSDGAMFDPALNTWTPMSASPLSARDYYAAVWSGSKIYYIGGHNGSSHKSFVSFDPVANTWETLPDLRRPTDQASGIWTGSKVFYWGGGDGAVARSDGELYNPATRTWTPVAEAGEPSARIDQSAVWTGSEIILWGGRNGGTYYNDGKRYNPQTDTWLPMATGPSSRALHSAVWTGKEMIVWGGNNGGTPWETSGGRYDPVINDWVLMDSGVIRGKRGHATVWTGKEMIVWAGDFHGDWTETGARYDPFSNTWTEMATLPPKNGLMSYVWTGKEMLIFGGLFTERRVWAYTPPNIVYLFSKQ